MESQLRRPDTEGTRAVIHAFNDAVNRHDVDAVMALMTDDCVFESTAPPPDGTRYQGAGAARAFWERFFRESPQARFDTEETVVIGDRCAVRWRYDWRDAQGRSGHVRGADLFRVRDGRVAEKLSYVKG